MELEGIKQQMRMLKEVVRLMTPEEKKIFAAFWVMMYKEMFGNVQPS